MANKNIKLNKKVDYIAGKTVRSRISRYLLDMYTAKGNENFSIPYNRNDFAEFLCVDRSVMSRELSKMKKEGIIDFNKNTFSLLDLDAIGDLSV